MPLPPGWVTNQGLPLPSGRRSLRFFVAGNTTANFADNAWNFAVAPVAGNALTIPPSVKVSPGAEVASGAAPSAVVSTPMGGQRNVAPASQASPVTTQGTYGIRVCNDGGTAIEFSFDGVNVHGIVLANSEQTFLNRIEAGIAVREPGGGSIAFRVFAW